MDKRDALGVFVAVTGLSPVDSGPTLPVAVVLLVAGAYLLAAPRVAGPRQRVDRTDNR
jgi:hypothetical protein